MSQEELTYKGKLLVVEDDRNLNRGICFALAKEGYMTVSAFSLKEAKIKLLDKDIEMLLLDLNLPDGDGISFFRELKDKITIPVIMLTARDMEVDEVLGLEIGAADYITKPFSLSVLKARVANIMRISKKGESFWKDSAASLNVYDEEPAIDAVDFLESGDYAGSKTGMAYKVSVERGDETGEWRFMDLLWKKKEMVFCKNGLPLNLSMTEYRLLSYFAQNEGLTLTKGQILAAVWDNDGKFVDENTLSVNIRRLRMKLDEREKEAYIRTVFGIGYCLGEGS